MNVHIETLRIKLSSSTFFLLYDFFLLFWVWEYLGLEHILNLYYKWNVFSWYMIEKNYDRGSKNV